MIQLRFIFNCFLFCVNSSSLLHNKSSFCFFTLLGFSHAYYWPVFTVTNDMLSLFLWATVTGHTRQSGSESGWQKEECNFYNQHVTFLRQSICLDLDPALALSHSFMHRRSLLPLLNPTTQWLWSPKCIVMRENPSMYRINLVWTQLATFLLFFHLSLKFRTCTVSSAGHTHVSLQQQKNSPPSSLNQHLVAANLQ